MLSGNASKPKGDIYVELIEKKAGRLSFKLSYSPGLKKYFKKDLFSLRYDRNIEDVPESILYIPAIANVAPVSWATGADLHVKELDATFIESLRTIKAVMKDMYPDFFCTGDINVGLAVNNHFGNKGSAQLFTSGIDSFATFARHRDEKPALITMGIYAPYSESLQRLIYGEMVRFAKKEGVALHRIESDYMNDFFNQKSLLADYGRYLHEASWWATVQHGLGLLGICAPVTAMSDIQRIYIASSMSKGNNKAWWNSWGSHPRIDDNVAWADVRAVHDGVELSRQEKIANFIKPYIEKTGNYPTIIVCNEPFRGDVYNCGRCEKCSRTIVGLSLEGIDPNRCGFSVSGRTFERIKQKLLMRPLRFIYKQPNMWRDIQNSIPDTIENDLNGSKAFFEWLRTFEIADDRRKSRPISQRVLEKCLQLGIIQ
ncbi:MAG TPA: hypothetical protein VMC84_06440 [Methanocella sp.]|uniref:hypothetical protein n=1 Tax=Methanocella sp. TaxID=2052833 RepID=UPI002CCC839D|nr:hypothetical protein [Methanocella sp.]HTY90799.1 hypothetical protein [Methanocella sp.]